MTAPVIVPATVRTRWTDGRVSGDGVMHAERRLRDLGAVFADSDAWASGPPDQLVYRTSCVFPVPDGTEAGLFWGTTFLQPGTVGGEYFMTKGHVHAKSDRMEVYFTFAGTGLLILMDPKRSCRVEEMTPGSVHLIPAHAAHRTVNIGDVELSFGACWPSDAGYNYDVIARTGFSVRAMRGAGGRPDLVVV